MGIYESDEPFRFAVVGDGGPLAPGTALDPRIKKRVLRFLRESSPVIVDPITVVPDVLDPAGPATVPRGYRTDGEWIWPDALAYYLDRYDIDLPEDFAPVPPAQGYHGLPVTAGRIGQARAAVLARGPGPYEPEPPAQTRFPVEVRDVLTTHGWVPGRLITERIDSWWAGAEPPPCDLPADLTSSGLAILYEFGDLHFPVYSYGPDWPVVGFRTLPWGRPSDPVRIAAADTRLGGPFFPLGYVESWRAEIVLSPRYGVVSVGEVDRFLGYSFDQALTSMILGVAPVMEAQA